MRKSRALGAEYVVGYGRPPVQHQFRRGQSGNPAGRPRRGVAAPGVDEAAEVAAAVRRVRGELVTIVVEGRRRRLPYIEAALYSLREDALRGDLRAFKLFEEFSARALAAVVPAAPGGGGLDVAQLACDLALQLRGGRIGSPLAAAGDACAAGQADPAGAALGDPGGGEGGGEGARDCGASPAQVPDVPHREARGDARAAREPGQWAGRGAAAALPPFPPHGGAPGPAQARPRRGPGPLIQPGTLSGVGWGVGGQ